MIGAGWVSGIVKWGGGGRGRCARSQGLMSLVGGH